MSGETGSGDGRSVARSPRSTAPARPHVLWHARRKSLSHSGGRGKRWRDEAGGASVLACFALAGLIAATLMLGHLGTGVVARHRVQAAADLAALAGAGALGSGTDAGCAVAREIARDMQARVRACAVSQWDVTVTAEQNVPMGLFGVRVVSAVARAGPVGEEL
ncbi:Rv3654c family TadE-like protein [Nocardia sp. NPDC048505]|uniref:Rv3654c family TadE-like protein n=1 Tax=unclassified Nocardia TaxID=2637762 RepID=UPI0033F27010